MGPLAILDAVKNGHLTQDCFEQHRMLGKGGFGTVYAVTRKFGTKEDQGVLMAMKRLDKKMIGE